MSFIVPSESEIVEADALIDDSELFLPHFSSSEYLSQLQTDDDDKLDDTESPNNEERLFSPSFSDIAREFGMLGFIAFGGPAAHVALFEKTFVDRKKWISSSVFTGESHSVFLSSFRHSFSFSLHVLLSLLSLLFLSFRFAVCFDIALFPFAMPLDVAHTSLL